MSSSHSASPFARAWLRGLESLLIPAPCPLCGRDDALDDDGVWHRACFSALRPRDRLSLGFATARRGVPVHALLDDTPLWFELLHRVKYGGEHRLLRPLAERLAGAVERGGGVGDACVLVPAPDDPTRRRSRGFSVVGTLASVLAARFGARLRADLLARGHAVASQTSLRDDAARARNLEGCLVTGDLASVPARARLLLVDDQVTSGATLRACIGRLGARGHVIGVVALARAARTPERVHP